MLENFGGPWFYHKTRTKFVTVLSNDPSWSKKNEPSFSGGAFGTVNIVGTVLPTAVRVTTTSATSL